MIWDVLGWKTDSSNQQTGSQRRVMRKSFQRDFQSPAAQTPFVLDHYAHYGHCQNVENKILYSIVLNPQRHIKAMWRKKRRNEIQECGRLNSVIYWLVQGMMLKWLENKLIHTLNWLFIKYIWCGLIQQSCNNKATFIKVIQRGSDSTVRSHWRLNCML